MARKDIPDRLICEVVSSMWAGGDGPVGDCLPAQLVEKTGEPGKVCRAAIERAYDRDLLEFGVSLNWPWLTDKGKALLQ
jgi:hypothetical protein